MLPHTHCVHFLPFLQALNQTQLDWQLANSCVDLDAMSEVIAEDVGGNQVCFLSHHPLETSSGNVKQIDLFL